MSPAAVAATAPLSKPVPVLLEPERICESPFNSRLVYDEKKMAELVATVAEHGIVQPIVVRSVVPYQNGKIDHEIVFGHRRYRAGVINKMRVIPALVVSMTDAEVLIAQAIENLQREDLNALEEGAHFKKLHAAPFNKSVADIAAAIGMSPEYVHVRIKLTSIVPAGRDAFLKGRLLSSVATAIARIGNAEQQALAVKEIAAGKDGEPMPAREAHEIIRRRYMLRLVDAPFKTDDKELLPKAGACTNCPKRTGNQALLFADLKDKDICTDTVCYEAKKDAAWRITAAAAKEQKQKVLPDKEGAKLFPYEGNSNLVYGSPFADLDAPCQEDPKRRPLKVVLAKVAELKPVLVRDPRGDVHRLVENKALPELLKQAGIEPVKAGASPADVDYRKREKAKRDKKRTEAASLISHVLDKVAKAGNVVALSGSALDGFVRLLAVAVLRGAHEGCTDVCKRRGLEYGKGKGTPPDVIRALVAKLSGVELRVLVVEVLVTHGAFFNYAAGYGEGLEAACKLYGIDIKKTAAIAVKAAAENKAAKKLKPLPKEKPEAPAKKAAKKSTGKKKK